MKKSISYWSFSGKNVFEAMRLAKDAGFDGIELTLDAEGDVTMEIAPEKLAEIRRAAEEIGIALPSVASSLYWANLCRSGRLWRMMCAGSARWPR